VEFVGSAPAPSVPQLFETFSQDEPAEVAAETELPGLADFRVALRMVACGEAHSITLCGFPDGHELLRVGRELAIEGVVVEPVIRSGGGGFDIRVRQASSSGV
jgi:hypothetical protein